MIAKYSDVVLHEERKISGTDREEDSGFASKWRRGDSDNLLRFRSMYRPALRW